LHCGYQLEITSLLKNILRPKQTPTPNHPVHIAQVIFKQVKLFEQGSVYRYAHCIISFRYDYFGNRDHFGPEAHQLALLAIDQFCLVQGCTWNTRVFITESISKLLTIKLLAICC